MNSLIKEINENLKAIIDNLKENMDNSSNTLENIQLQMDKKVEEAKKYKIQVDSAKDKIKELENDNKSLESSLKELNDKYGKMNLVSIVEAGNREIKTKINDNNREINKQKEHIAELTNKARTIKDLLINLKKDKSIKEERLENIKVVYAYYSDRINSVIDYAFDHSENLAEYNSNDFIVNNNEVEITEVNDNQDLDNTMVFDEIANIDDNKNFKDEMSFITDQINENIDFDKDKINDLIKNSLDNYDFNDNDSEDVIEDNVEESIEDVEVIDSDIDSTQVFDSILDEDSLEEDSNDDESVVGTQELALNIDENQENKIEDLVSDEKEIIKEDQIKSDVEEIEEDEELSFNKFNIFNTQIEPEELKIESDEDKLLDEENQQRIDKINDLFSTIDSTKTATIPVSNTLSDVNSVEKSIDSAYLDIFGKPLEESDLNKETTLTDIFGNPIKKEELSTEVVKSKKIEEVFKDNGIDFNKFREDEKNYLKEIYEEEKFINILNTLKRNKINLDNIYNAFNVFGEITPNELENLINKLINVGQSVEAIGIVLEKLPKVKKYNLDEAIISYGDYVKNVEISELIMKAKELYKKGGNN